MTKLEFDQKIFDKVAKEFTTYDRPQHWIKAYLELAQEPPKPVLEAWLNVYENFVSGMAACSLANAQHNTVRCENLISTRHLRYNHETGKIEDITEEEDA